MAREQCEQHTLEIDRINEKLARWEHIIEGNGKAPLIVRLDRIEQLVAVCKWLIAAVIVETLALGGNLIVMWIHK